MRFIKTGTFRPATHKREQKRVGGLFAGGKTQARLAVVLTLLLPAFGVAAQEGRALIEFNPIDGISAEESRLIGDFIVSYLSGASPDLAETPFRVEKNAGPVPDYIISGSIHSEENGQVFILEIANAKTGKRYTANLEYRTPQQLLLKIQSALISAIANHPQQQGELFEDRLNESIVNGTWRGEDGILQVRLLPGGAGFMVFSSGTQMELSYRIESNVLRIRQRSANSELFYIRKDIDIDLAKILAKGAEPVEWELSLTGHGVLAGIKISTEAKMENGEIVLVPGGDVRQVEWTKIEH